MSIIQLDRVVSAYACIVYRASKPSSDQEIVRKLTKKFGYTPCLGDVRAAYWMTKDNGLIKEDRDGKITKTRQFTKSHYERLRQELKRLDNLPYSSDHDLIRRICKSR